MSAANRPATVANWRAPEMIRHSFQQIESFLPTVPISRGAGPVAELPEAPAPLAELVVSAEHGTVADVHASTETDAWLVLHEGRLIAEEYVAPMTATTRHLVMSVTKSIVSVVVGALVDRGTLDPSEQVTTYVPELADSGYTGATLRDVLDMRTGIRFPEDYFDPDSGAALLDEAVGWAPRTHGGPGTLKQFLRSRIADRPHGGFFEYRSCETAVLGWVCESASDRPFAELASELLWSRLGTESNASLCVDSDGTGVFDGGVTATARDLARFGAMVLSGGTSPTGEHVVGQTWIDDLFAQNGALTAAFAAGPDDETLPGGAYRSQFWLPPGGHAVACVGIHGQFVYIDRSASMVGVKLSSWPMPLDPNRIAATLKVFTTITNHLANR